MKKFGTPMRAGPGVASEKVGLDGEGGVAAEDEPRAVPPAVPDVSELSGFAACSSHAPAALPRASEGRRGAGVAPRAKARGPEAAPAASLRRRRRSAAAARRRRSRAAATACSSHGSGAGVVEVVVVAV